jgi:hypothetical protein
MSTATITATVSRPSGAKIANHFIDFAIDGAKGRRTVLQLLAVLYGESETPREKIAAFGDFIETGSAAGLAVVRLTSLGRNELLCDDSSSLPAWL